MKKQTQDFPIIITKHAFKRAKRRLSFKAHVLKKMAMRAYELGIKHTQTRGFLHKYMDKLYTPQDAANNLRIYGDILYLFADNILITLYPIPSTLRKLAKVSKH